MRRALALTLVALFCVAGERDEKELFDHAVKHANRRTWREADRAFQEYLNRFPDGPRAEDALFRLGQLHLHASRRYAVARNWFAKFAERHPKSDRVWQARWMVAQTFERQKLKQRALEAYRALLDCPDPSIRTNAAHTVLRLQDKHLRPHVNQTFTAGTYPQVHVQARNIDQAEFRLYKVPYGDVLDALPGVEYDLRRAIAGVRRDRRELIQTYRVALWQPDRRWHNKQVMVPAKDAGLYVLETAHDGITMDVTVIISRVGFVTKSSAGELLVFAQDRTTGAPVAGMPVRAREGDTLVEGTTDADGLFSATGLNRAFLVGEHEGEFVFATTWASGWAEKRSRYYVTTERPIYRPNQTVHFKITHRIEGAGALLPQPGLRLKVLIDDPRGNRVHETEARLNEFGTAHGAFTLAAEPALGHYRIHLQPLDGTAPTQGWYGANLSDQGRFRVDEYRKPEFKVDVAFPEAHFIQGDTLRATVRADYYFGSPVPDANVTYRILKARWWGWHRRPYWADWYGESGFHGGHGEQVHQGDGRTDADGRLQVEFALPREDQDVRYTVVAEVTDKTRKQIAGAASVQAYQAEFGLRVAFDRYVVKPDRPFEVTLEARWHDGKPAAGRTVRVRAFHRTWRDGETHETGVFEAVGLETGADGTVTVPVQTPKQGYVRLLAEGADARGRTVRAERYVWVVSRDWDGGHMNWSGVQIVADKETYAPGDVATFLITSETKDAALLFTLEATRVVHRQVVRLAGNTATVQVRLDAAWAPNVYATVAGLGEGRMVQSQANVLIDPSERFFTVEIRPDKKTYRPREPASFTIVTRDRDGNPVPAEVALAVVDESIYALQEEFAADIRAFFVRRRWNHVRTGGSMQYWDYGRAGEDREDGETTIDIDMREPAEPREELRSLGAKKAAAYAETEVRAEFADTMFWGPTVVTGADGTATVRLDKVADNLTTWRLTARGITKSGLVGQEKDSILVRKDVIVRLHTPRFFTQGDASTVTAVVRNDLDERKQVKFTIAAEGLELDGERERILVIDPKGERRVDFRARVGAPGKATFIVHALTDEESDALELTVPVYPHGSLRWHSAAGLLEGPVEQTVTAPEGDIREAAELLVVVSPSHAATVLDALDYLADYPYGCVEQTMSRFLPTVVTGQVLRRLGLSRPDLEAELPHMIRQGLHRLYHFQHRDGGWGWWRDDASSPFTTAYVVYGLALAREADVAVDGRVFARGVAACRALLKKADDPEQRAYLLYALSVAGQSAPDVRNALADGLAKLPAPGKAMLALALHRDGEAGEARRVLDALAKEAKTVGAVAHWDGAARYHWTGHPVDATALALQAFLKIRPDHELVKRAVTWLALNREGRHWVSTRQTAMVVFALAEYIARTGEREPDMTVTVDVNGERLFERRITKDNWHAFDGTVKVPGARLRAGKNTVTIRGEGAGTPVWSLFFKRFEHADSFAPSEGGLVVRRTYSRIVFEGGERRLVPLGNGARVKSGDEIEVQLEVESDRPHKYLMLEDPLPAGFEPVRDPPVRWYGHPWRHWYAHKEFRDEKVDIAVTHLPAGERSLTYTMRAETPGTFRVLPAIVWNMYRPGEGANSAGLRIEVTE